MQIPGNYSDGSSDWVPATQEEDLDCILALGPQPCVLGTIVNEPADGSAGSFSFLVDVLSFKYIRRKKCKHQKTIFLT